MNHLHLRAFHAIAGEGSVTAAAALLRVSQPTLSAQVKALEEAYGVALFDRRGRGVVPTPLGQSLFEVTRRLFLLEEEATELLERARELSAGHLRMGAGDPYHAIPLLAAFRQRYPGVQVSLTMGNADTVLDDLLRCRTDVAASPDVADDPRLHTLFYAAHRLVLFVPRGHAWAGGPPVPLPDLAQASMVLREQGSQTRRLLEAALAAAGVRLGRVMEIGSREAVREAVASGLGVGVVSEAEFGHDQRLVTVEIAGPPIETREYLVCLKERRNLRVVAAFFDEVRALAQPSRWTGG